MVSQCEPTPETLVRAIEEMTADLDGPTIPWTLLTVLDRLIPSVEVGFIEMDYRRRPFVSTQFLEHTVETFEGEVDAREEPWWSMAAAATTAATPRLSPPGRIQRWTAELSRADLRSWPLCQQDWREVGDLLSVDFPAPPGCTRRLLLWREGTDRFSSRDEIVVQLLRPHLFEVDRLARRRREGSPILTAREWQVLELVAQGASNAEVAAALVTSVATVRKHMEHIFDRSGVRTRSAAVAKLMPVRPTKEVSTLRG